MFKKRFFASLLSIPVFLYSPGVQELLNFSVPGFPGSERVSPVLAVVVFAYGGSVHRNGRSGTPCSDTWDDHAHLVATTVAFVYSLATVVAHVGMSFLWELVTLIDIMLLGHWIGMRSVRQASGALTELAKLLPDTAERITESGATGEVPVGALEESASRR